MRTPAQKFEDLIVWQKAHALTLCVYRVTRTFPREELFGLTSQMRRAAISVPANIAEGAARRSTRELLHFLSIASGSLSELDTHLVLAAKLGLITDVAAVNAKVDEVFALLVGLSQSLKAKSP